MTSLDVVILGQVDEDLGDLGAEVTRAKAALLYGDRVSLATHKVPLLLARMTARARTFSRAVLEGGGIDGEIAEAVAQTIERRMADEEAVELKPNDLGAALQALRGEDPNVVLHLPEALAEMLRQRGGRPAGDPGAGFGLLFPTAVESYVRGRGEAEERRARAAARELVELSAHDVVDVSWGTTHDVASVEFDDLAAATARAVTDALDLLTSARREHPLFTASTRLALRDARAANRLEGADFTRANRVELAARLVAAVPTFPEASVSEIMDLRERVAPHLQRFRAAVADFEDALTSDVLADDFDRAVDDLRQRQVDPALEELRESLRDTGADRALARATPTVATSTLALGAALATGSFELAGVAAVAAGVGAAAAKEYLERHRQEDQRRSHKLFLLFDAERALADRRGR